MCKYCTKTAKTHEVQLRKIQKTHLLQSHKNYKNKSYKKSADSVQLKHKIRFDAVQICFNAANIKTAYGI